MSHAITSQQCHSLYFFLYFKIKSSLAPRREGRKNKSGQHFLLDLTWPTSFSTHNFKMCKLRPSLSPSCGGNGRWQRRLITIAHVFFNLVFSAANIRHLSRQRQWHQLPSPASVNDSVHPSAHDLSVSE